MALAVVDLLLRVTHSAYARLQAQSLNSSCLAEFTGALLKLTVHKRTFKGTARSVLLALKFIRLLRARRPTAIDRSFSESVFPVGIMGRIVEQAL
jgi:hypothetical protein